MNKPDIHNGRLPAEEYRRNFADIKPPLSDYQAHIEASRCLYCEAAPCIPACPTGINIPSFINRIATDNIDGAAQAILDANILGGSCARVCPTEVLCEQACVRNHEPECLPVKIGLLQRYAIDNRQSADHPFTRLPETGKAMAVEDALPAISSLRQCHDLSQLPVGRRIVVIGGGNTAIDIACQCKRLGAEDVTIAYRRGREQMSATGHEQAFARDNGVRILTIELITDRPLQVSLDEIRQTKKDWPDRALLVSLINTINSITGIDLDRMVGYHAVNDKFTSGGYCGEAVKPIALNMVGQIARSPDTAGLPISAIGGISTWRDAAEFMALGAGTVQVCTAAMLNGFKIVQDMIDGLSRWMDRKHYPTLDSFQGAAVPNLTDWKYLNLNYKTIAHIDQDSCIQCGRCYAACEDAAHQAIAMTPIKQSTQHRFGVIEEACVGCNLCQITCPVDNCISMVRQQTGKPYLNWTQHPNNRGQEGNLSTEQT